MSEVETIEPVWLLTVETVAEEGVCVPTHDVLVDVTVITEGDDSDSWEFTCATKNINSL